MKDFEQAQQSWAAAKIKLKQLELDYIKYKNAPDNIDIMSTCTAVPCITTEEIEQALHTRSVHGDWPDDMIDEFIQLYPTATNENLALRFHISVRQVGALALKYDLEKDPRWYSEMRVFRSSLMHEQKRLLKAVGKHERNAIMKHITELEFKINNWK